MTIIECLKGEANNSVVVNSNRWLYWDRNRWIVRQHGQKRGDKIKVVIETPDENEAVRALLGIIQ